MHVKVILARMAAIAKILTISGLVRMNIGLVLHHISPSSSTNVKIVGTYIWTVKSFKCLCPKGFKGDRCEINAVSDPCLSSPCVNGICRQRHPTNQRTSTSENSKFWCDCVAGFEGDRCEIQIDHCKGNPCPRDAVMCINSITEPQCICKVVSFMIHII